MTELGIEHCNLSHEEMRSPAWWGGDVSVGRTTVATFWYDQWYSHGR
jgi:hypothetical protein